MKPLKAGDIVWFDFLHLDKAKKAKTRPVDGSTDVLYLVKGKSRPMLVLGPIEENYGKAWYRLVKLTTKGHRKNDRVCVGRILDGLTSFAELEPYCYPENLATGREEDPLTSDKLYAILQIITTAKMGLPST
jgi:hypothetical protein